MLPLEQLERKRKAFRFRQACKARMAKQGITIEGLALMAGLSPDTVREALNTQAVPSKDTITKIASVLSIIPDLFI
ncbi:MAG: XRE family transcriptional regulator [Gammaproteobacteria bacterium]|nr:XRE family transcriptional regulator [Gammaproteobacteria bacterium]